MAAKSAKSEKKKEILLNSFDLIKDNFDNNYVQICGAVTKMLSIDEETATEMWLYLLDKHSKELKGNHSAYLTDWVFNDNINDSGKFDELVLSNNKIKNAMFSHFSGENESPVHFFRAIEIIERRILAGDYATANELLDLLKKNKYHKIPWYYFMEDLIVDLKRDSDGELPDEAIDLLNEWCSKEKSKEKKAKLQIYMVDLM